MFYLSWTGGQYAVDVEHSLSANGVVPPMPSQSRKVCAAEGGDYQHAVASGRLGSGQRGSRTGRKVPHPEAQCADELFNLSSLIELSSVNGHSSFVIRHLLSSQVTGGERQVTTGTDA